MYPLDEHDRVHVRACEKKGVARVGAANSNRAMRARWKVCRNDTVGVSEGGVLVELDAV
jgi:hypothetical protein